MSKKRGRGQPRFEPTQPPISFRARMCYVPISHGQRDPLSSPFVSPHIDAFGSKLGSIKFMSKVEKAYNRTRMVEQRREVVER